jgi:hypothetical protein
LPETVVVDQIRAAGTKAKFDLSTDEVIRLSRSGVTPAMLEAMRDPSGTPSVPAVPAPVAAPAPEAKQVAVLSGLPVTLVLAGNVPNDPTPGTPLKFTVKEDFLVNSSIAIAAGATATGEVAGIKKGILRGGKATFKLIAADAVDGTKIALRATPGNGDEKSERVLEPPNRKDKTLLAPAGTEYVGYIDGAHSVVVRK